MHTTYFYIDKIETNFLCTKVTRLRIDQVGIDSVGNWSGGNWSFGNWSGGNWSFGNWFGLELIEWELIEWELIWVEIVCRLELSVSQNNMYFVKGSWTCSFLIGFLGNCFNRLFGISPFTFQFISIYNLFCLQYLSYLTMNK